jgi:hypothetical protein
MVSEPNRGHRRQNDQNRSQSPHRDTPDL